MVVFVITIVFLSLHALTILEAWVSRPGGVTVAFAGENAGLEQWLGAGEMAQSLKARLTTETIRYASHKPSPSADASSRNWRPRVSTRLSDSSAESRTPTAPFPNC